MPRFVFITGGVCSSLGKGLASASLGALLKARGFSVILRKLDPYLNVDPGTLSPFEHGEVYVTDDGVESDLDLGHYERFADVTTTSLDYITTGKIYLSVLLRERKGEYLGKTVQVVPHITDAIKQFIINGTQRADFVLCEIGGTVGDIEGLPYLEAIRQLRNDLGKENTMFLHLTLLPYLPTSGEIKTKPTQHSVKQLLGLGIQPDILLCRTTYDISLKEKNKIALFCNIPYKRVIVALDADTIYRVPIQYYAEELDEQVCNFFGKDSKKPELKAWNNIVHTWDNAKQTVPIAIVGKYVKLKDAYQSLIQALIHAGLHQCVKPDIIWVDSEKDIFKQGIDKVCGIIVPGGFGERGISGKINAIKFARINNIPFLGICLGMQLAIIEACRNQLGLISSSSAEFSETKEPVIDRLVRWEKDGEIELRSLTGDIGGTMRLGAYPCHIDRNSLVYQIYRKDIISERHRHRYEVNKNYESKLNKADLYITGKSPDGLLPEIIERKGHPFFIGVQFHPELKSRLFSPHPLFVAFVKESTKYN
ncbi:MAG: CTP synthase [Alphaproteobacteria bacterium]